MLVARILAQHAQQKLLPTLPALSEVARLQVMVNHLNRIDGDTLLPYPQGVDAMHPMQLRALPITGTAFEHMAAGLRELGLPVEDTVGSVMDFGWLSQGHLAFISENSGSEGSITVYELIDALQFLESNDY